MGVSLDLLGIKEEPREISPHELKLTKILMPYQSFAAAPDMPSSVPSELSSGSQCNSQQIAHIMGTYHRI